MNEEDAPCDVCRSNEVDPDDKIIFCDKCDIAVHQICYGIEEIPSGSWLCKTCENDIQPICIFCRQKKGAMKNTVDGRWAHVNCTLWIPETNFANPETMDFIQNVDKIPKSRWNLSCFICRVKGGACIQCYVPTCKTAYHVTCGYNNGLHMKMEDVVTSESEIIFESYCRKHTEKKFDLGKKKNKKNSAEDKILAQLLSNAVSRDSTAKNSSSSTNIDKANENDVKVKEEKKISFKLSNTSTNEDNENEEVTMEDVVEQSMGHNENGDQLLMNNKVSKRTYIGTFLVGKATARKSCASPNIVQGTALNKVQEVQVTLQDKVQRIILDKSKGTIRNKVQGEKPSNVKKVKQLRDILPKKTVKGRNPRNKPQLKANGTTPKNLSKGEVNQSPVTSSETAPVNSPNLEKQVESNLTLNHLTVTPQNFSTQNNDQNFSYLGQPVAMLRNHSPYPGPQSSASMEIATMMQNLPSSSTISNSSNLYAFLGYLGSLLQSLPMKKSLKVQKKVIAQVLKEHNVSSSDDISDVCISDESSMSD